MPARTTDIAAAATLDDPTRRAVYVAVRGARRPVTKDEVAATVGLSPRLAAFHLDKLCERDLLVVQRRVPPGRTGRPANYYERSRREIRVTIPERRYELAATLMLEALRSTRAHDDAVTAARRVARKRGMATGARRRGTGGDPSRRIRAALTEVGYEPYQLEPGTIALRNCPFHALVEEDAPLMCAMNVSFVQGLLEGAGAARSIATFSPRPDECCVLIRQPSAKRRSGPGA